MDTSFVSLPPVWNLPLRSVLEQIGHDVLYARVTCDLCNCCVSATTHHTLSDWDVFYLGPPHWLLNRDAFWCYFYWLFEHQVPRTRNVRCAVKSPEWRQCHCSTSAKPLCTWEHTKNTFVTLERIFHIGVEADNHDDGITRMCSSALHSNYLHHHFPHV